MPRPIKSTLRRHSIKSSKTKTGLTKSGIELARSSGRKNLSGKVKGYHSGATRAESTLRFEMSAHRRAGGKAYPKTRKKKELSYDFIYNMDGLLSELGKIGSEEKFLRKWLDGKVSKKLIASPKSVADSIIKKRFGLGQRVARTGTKDRQIENVSHSWIVEAVFERLTGEKYGNILPGTGARETEGLSINHYKNGKAVLRFRGKSFDVTKKLNQILKS